MNAWKVFGLFSVIGLLFYLAWGAVEGSGFELLWLSTEEVAAFLEEVWTSTLIVAAGGSVLTVGANIVSSRTPILGVAKSN